MDGRAVVLVVGAESNMFVNILVDDNGLFLVVSGSDDVVVGGASTISMPRDDTTLLEASGVVGAPTCVRRFAGMYSPPSLKM